MTRFVEPLADCFLTLKAKQTFASWILLSSLVFRLKSCRSRHNDRATLSSPTSSTSWRFSCRVMAKSSKRWPDRSRWAIRDFHFSVQTMSFTPTTSGGSWRSEGAQSVRLERVTSAEVSQPLNSLSIFIQEWRTNNNLKTTSSKLRRLGRTTAHSSRLSTFNSRHRKLSWTSRRRSTTLTCSRWSWESKSYSRRAICRLSVR